MNNSNWILYDGECPFCSNYANLIKLRESVGPVRIINAREDTPERKEIEKLGLDLDEGMAFSYEGHIYHGHACVHIIADLTESTGIFNRLNHWVFRSHKRARFFYPALRCGRNMVLKLKGTKKINS